MKRNLLITLLLLCALSSASAETKRQAQARAEVISRSRGYYKEVFMDGGIALTSRYSLSAAKFLGVEMEYFASAAKRQSDTEGYPTANQHLLRLQG